ncbi:MAG: hypothetical protein JST00_07460 [Deltaproteobacteria bacterium]|nr:hypothetical protein [Deltaproteobacteria bacterium]
MKSERGAMALTVSQMFIGAVSLGIGMFRGTEVQTAFHQESTLAHASYGASKTAADHARSANVVVNNNVTMGAIMGPRFAVEADNITMDANAMIACPTCPYSPTCKVCIQYKANKPRAVAKMVWVRAKQQLLWGTLGKLSGDIDKLAFQQAQGLVNGDVAKIDAKVRMRFDDPSMKGEIWGGGNADVACKLAMKDTLPSPMTGHAFPILITPNLLEGLPKALVQMMPQMICKATSAAQNAMGGGGGGGGGGDQPIRLPEVKSVSDKTKADCKELEDAMRCSVAAANGQPGMCGDSMGVEISDLSEAAGRVQLPSKVQPFVTCQAASPSSPLQQSGGGYFYRQGGSLTTCSFDRQKCEDKKLEENSDDFMRSSLGLPKIISNLASALGGSETRKPSSGGSAPKDFCTCAFSSKPVDETTIGVSDAVRRIASFGMASPSEALRKQRDYRSCGRWYFPDRQGQFASTPSDEQPFVAAWKWNETSKCGGQ